MCQQTVCLLQAAIERAGIATVSISLLREVTSVIKPPRALFVSFPMGYPLGAPKDAPLQHRIIAAAQKAIDTREPVRLEYRIRNAHRSVGAMLSGVVARKFGHDGLPPDIRADEWRKAP